MFTRLLSFIFAGSLLLGMFWNVNATQASQDFPSRCAEEPELVGPCRALIPSWSFIPDTGKCVSFNYGGCQGNNNRFDTEKECMDICKPFGCLDLSK